MAEETSMTGGDGIDAGKLPLVGKKRKLSDGGGLKNQNAAEEEDVDYGCLVLLGYQGENGLNKGPQRKFGSKYCLKKRSIANGVKPSGKSQIVTDLHKSKAFSDQKMYSVAYYSRPNCTTVVTYEPDDMTDLFQVGRLCEKEIDFTVVGPWPYESADTTISRYSCRILVSRQQPHTASLFAAGFDAKRNIFLGEKACRWTNRKGENDGFTTNGVLILHPHWTQTSDDFYEWRELSVGGGVHEIRQSGESLRYDSHPGKWLKKETNELKDGSLIDICGATLLYRTAEGMKNSPSKRDIETRLSELNAGKPQCPVQLTTLYIPKGSTIGVSADSKVPLAYINCGHVQSRHGWGANGSTFMCPLCKLESTAVLTLSVGVEPAFHYDSDSLTHAFNPCGHLGSEKTVKYWARIPLPKGSNQFAAVCPFCSTRLATEKPFVRLHFQDHCGFETEETPAEPIYVDSDIIQLS